MTRGLSGVAFLKGTSPIHEGSTLVTPAPPRGPTWNTLLWGLRLSAEEFGGDTRTCSAHLDTGPTEALKSGLSPICNEGPAVDKEDTGIYAD